MASLPDMDAADLLAARAGHSAELLTLPLRDRNWKGEAGTRFGSGSGSSLDFHDHRAYLPGDDPRHINWQAYARSGQYSLKLFRDEVRPAVEIIFDISGSMFADGVKATRSLELLLFALASARQAGAGVSIVLVSGCHWRKLPRLAHSGRTLVGEIKTNPTIEASVPPNLPEIPLKPRSLRVFISDLLYPADPETLLPSLARSGGRGLVLAPYTLAEAEPPWQGNCEFEDSETGVLQQRRVDPDLMKRYRTAYRDHFARWKAASLRHQVPLGRVPSAGSFASALQSEALPAGAVRIA